MDLPARVGALPGSGSYLNLSSATAGTQIKSGPGQLLTIAINIAASGSIIDLYDGNWQHRRALQSHRLTATPSVPAR